MAGTSVCGSYYPFVAKHLIYCGMYTQYYVSLFGDAGNGDNYLTDMCGLAATLYIYNYSIVQTVSTLVKTVYYYYIMYLYHMTGRTFQCISALIDRLAEAGHKVVGVEIVEKAVKGFFSDNHLPYEEKQIGSLVRYRVRL